MDFLCMVSSLSKVQNLWMHNTLIQYRAHHNQQIFDGLVCDSALQEPYTIVKPNSVHMCREENSNVYHYQALSHTCCSSSYHNVATKGQRLSLNPLTYSTKSALLMNLHSTCGQRRTSHQEINGYCWLFLIHRYLLSKWTRVKGF